jgi:hypothetical protein
MFFLCLSGIFLNTLEDLIPFVIYFFKYFRGSYTICDLFF